MNKKKKAERNWRSTAINALCILISLSVGFGLVEAALRLVGFKPYRPVDVLFQADPELGFTLIDSTSQVMETSEGRYLVTIADRQRSIPDQKCTPGGAKTYVYGVGDSFCFGHGVDDQNVWIDFLARSIGQSHDLCFHNMGVSGYSPLQYHLVIEKLPQDLKNAVVIYLFFMGNDFTSTTAEDFRQNASKVSFRPYRNRFLAWASYHSAAVWSVCSLAITYRERHVNVDYFKSQRDFESYELSRPDWSNTISLVSNSLELVQKRGGKPLLVAIPNGKQYLNKESEMVGRLIGSRFCGEVKKRVPNLAVLDLSQYLHSGNDLMFESMGHFNTKGNQWMAGLIEPMLENLVKP